MKYLSLILLANSLQAGWTTNYMGAHSFTGFTDFGIAIIIIAIVVAFLVFLFMEIKETIKDKQKFKDRLMFTGIGILYVVGHIIIVMN